MNKLLLKLLPIIYRAFPIPGWLANKINSFLNVDITALVGATVVKCKSGVKVFIKNPRDLIQKQLYFQGYFEYKETHVLKSYLKEGMTFLDIGANIGWHTLLAAKYVGDIGKVISFEPVENTFNHLKENVSLNKLGNVNIFKFALSDTDGSFPIYPISENNDGSNSLFSFNDHDIPIEYIESRVGSELLKSIAINKVDFCKIDVEGAEIKVINGLNEFFTEKRIKTLMIELNDAALKRASGSANELVSKLKSFGYEIVDIKTNKLINEYNLPSETNLLCRFV